MNNVPLLIRFGRRYFFVNNREFIYKYWVLFLTFFVYICYHQSRKPISVVKSILHQNNCSDYALSHHVIIDKSNATFCNWKPFDGDDWSLLLGALDYSYLFAYAVGMFFSGHIADRMDLRLFLTGGMLLCGLTTAAFGAGFYLNIHNIYFYIIVQIVGGFVQSSGWPAVVACVGNWFGKGRRGFILGVWNSHTSFGNIIGSVLAGVFVNEAWGLSFIVPGALIFGMGLVVYVLLCPYPEDVGCTLPDHETPKTSLPIEGSTSTRNRSRRFDSSTNSMNEDVLTSSTCVDENDEESFNTFATTDSTRIVKSSKGDAISILTALKIPGVIEFSLCLFFAKLVSYSFLFWLPQYIKHSTGFDPQSSADMSTLFDAGGIVGGILAGVLNDHFGKPASTCLLMLTLAIPSMLLYQIYGHVNMSLFICLLILVGLLVNGPYALITTAVSANLGTQFTDSNSRALATVTAIIDGTGSIGAACGPFLIGIVVVHGWNYVFYMLIASNILAMLVSVRIAWRTEWNYMAFTYSCRLPRLTGNLSWRYMSLSLILLTVTVLLVVIFY